MSQHARTPLRTLKNDSLKRVSTEVMDCTLCPRLRRHCLTMAETKRKAYLRETYWGLPISGFGDPDARLFIVGLAPAAHGANRTGRIFTGDRSGDWLYRALHKVGFANQPTSIHRNDGLELKDTWISCTVKCAPPDNKPSPLEIRRCSGFLKREIALQSKTRVYLALGGIALNGVWPFLVEKFELKGRSKPIFKHGARVELSPGVFLLMSYHPSQQNTFTGRLTEPMFDGVFSDAAQLINWAKSEAP